MKQPFWTSGIRFECQQSGRCCTSRGEYGFVYLTGEDRDRLAKHLQLSVEDFVRHYCGRELVGAHSAEADAAATIDVLQAQLERYPDLPQDVAGLHQACATILEQQKQQQRV